MHNIHELEKQWLNYKIKSLIPLFSVLLLSIVALIIFLNIDMSSASKPTPIAAKIKVETKPKIVVKKVVENIVEKVEVKEVPKIKLKQAIKVEDEIILTPSLDFIKKLRHDSNNAYKSNTNSNTIIQAKIIEPEVKVEVEEKVEVKVEKKVKVKILQQETQADIEHVIKRFTKNNNPALSLFVAKKYYKLGQYDKSYNYALLTNQLNSEIDASWIIFSKSLVKLNKRNKAIAVLKKYINHSHSSNAKVLLDDIISGKFK